MNQAIVESEVRRACEPDSVAPPRVDMYTLVHKGIRAFMGATLEVLGRLDERDADEVAHTLAQVRSLAMFLRAHLHHENQFVHPALEARNPGAARRTAGDHVEHERAIEHLGVAVLAVEKAGDAGRAGAVLALYRELAQFTAENLEHMHFEETENNAQLWATYSDDELQRIHEAMLASIEPAIFALGVRWMAPAMTPVELAGFAAHLPAPIVLGLREVLSERDWAKLVAAIGPIAAPN